MSYKSYFDYMSEISSSELFESLLAYGLFTDKLPPVFTSEDFYNYSLQNMCNYNVECHNYIRFNSIRNSSVPRQLGIPHPFAYAILCNELSKDWNTHILPFFKTVTSNRKYKVSKIHLRKMYLSKALFQMSYENYKTDGTVENDLMIGKRFMVKADISTCFPSIYSHSIAWALVGKDQAKAMKNTSIWYNDIDKCSRNSKNGETNGIIIGPHASNLISEIILTKIDSNLSEYCFVRHIDDYTMFAENEEEAEKFVLDLSEELAKYNLILNHKKTKVIKLPITREDDWVRYLNSFSLSTNYGLVDYKLVKSYLDLAVELTIANNNASAILYALKVLASVSLTPNGQELCVKEAMHFSFIYPYLIPHLKEYVFDIYNLNSIDISSFINKLYIDSLKRNNYEGVYYCLYYAICLDIVIDELEEDSIINSTDCITKILFLLYCKKNSNGDIVDKLEKNALSLIANDEFDENWLFVYEALPSDKFSGEIKTMKDSNISFIRQGYRF